MPSHEQENYFSDDQDAYQSEESSFRPERRRTLRTMLGALAAGAVALGAYKGNEFLSNLIEQKNQAEHDAKQAELALEQLTQEKSSMLLAYRESAFDDAIDNFAFHGFSYGTPLGNAMSTLMTSKNLLHTLKQAMLIPEYESRFDAFLRMHPVAQSFVAEHFPNEINTEKTESILTDFLAYATSRGAISADPKTFVFNGSGLDRVDCAFGMLSDWIDEVSIPWRVRNNGQPPEIIRPLDLFVEELTRFSADLRANPHPIGNLPAMTKHSVPISSVPTQLASPIKLKV